MSQYNARAVILRINANHSIQCSAADERRLVTGVSGLLNKKALSEKGVQELVSVLPTAFFQANGFDNPEQYARLLWEALDTSELTMGPQAALSNVTNFYGSVQAQVLQTGPNSTTKVVQESHQNQLYSKTVHRELGNVTKAIEAEIVDDRERTKALQIVERAKREAAKPDPEPTKVKKILAGLGKWTGERLTKAVDAAIEVGVKYGLTGPSA
jgi:hypothetical protein